jgi:type I restriction enzyme S subunit
VSQANISAGKLRDFPVPVPALEEQREIIAVLDAVDAKIELHKRKRVLVDRLFASVLHKFMTGDVRVADVDLSALEPRVGTEAAA